MIKKKPKAKQTKKVTFITKNVARAHLDGRPRIEIPEGARVLAAGLMPRVGFDSELGIMVSRTLGAVAWIAVVERD